MDTASDIGKVLTTLTTKKRINEANAQAGLGLLLPEAKVRSITLQDVLVDTGATTLCLPQEAIATLGLELLKEVSISTATDAVRIVGSLFDDSIKTFDHHRDRRHKLG